MTREINQILTTQRFKCQKKTKDKESQSSASETELVKHLNAFQPIYNPKSKGEKLGCFI